MILEALVEVLTSFLSFVIGLFPTQNPPSWVMSASATMQTVWDAASGLGAWVPWSMVSAVVQAVLACMVAGLVIRLVRIVLSLFTGGGGSAA